jgi:hypothetical protein
MDHQFKQNFGQTLLGLSFYSSTLKIEPNNTIKRKKGKERGYVKRATLTTQLKKDVFL